MYQFSSVAQSCPTLCNPMNRSTQASLSITNSRSLPELMFMDFPGGSDGKAFVYNVRDLGSIPGLGRFPGEGNGNPLQYSCLENPMDGRAW